MQNPPAVCPKCGAFFRSSLIGIAAGGTVTFSNIAVSCPYCGNIASVVDGTYDAVDDILRFVSGPQYSRELLQKFGDLLVDALEQQTSIDELEKSADAIDPRLGEIIRRTKYKPLLSRPLLLLLIAVISRLNISVNMNADVKMDVNKLVEQITNRSPKEVCHDWKTKWKTSVVKTNDTGDNKGDKRANSFGGSTKIRR